MISGATISAAERSPLIDDWKSFVEDPAVCTLPWNGFSLFPDGSVRNCAITDEILGNTHQQPIEEILQNQTNKSIRNDMINGHRHDRCRACYRVEDLQPGPVLNKISNRIWYMKKLGRHDLSIYQNDQQFIPRVLDIRWRNTCNLACIYCGSDLSSRWAQELGEPHRSDEPTFKRNQQWIMDNLHEVRHVYLAGGEPLLIRENLDLLERLSEINPDATVRVNTNLSVIQNNKIAELLLDHFPNTQWTVSLDSTGDSFEYMRWPGNWASFQSNLDYLRSRTNAINFNMVWCAVNAYSIFDAVDWITDLGFHHDTIVIQPLYSPRWLSVNNLDQTDIEQIRQLIQSKKENTHAGIYCNGLDSMLSYLDIEFEKNLEATRQNLSIMNQRRGLDFTDSLKYLHKR